MKSKAMVGAAALVLGGLLAGCASGGGGAASANAAAGGDLDSQFALQIQPILRTNCTGCHGPTRSSGGVNLVFPNLAVAQSAEYQDTWNRVRLALTSNRMPPVDAPQRLTDEHRAQLIGFVTANLAR